MLTHEPIKATGIRRTLPNMMTREGVRGMEYQAWGGGNPITHTLTLPFTRQLSGPIDYTPGIFDVKFAQYKKDQFVKHILYSFIEFYLRQKVSSKNIKLMKIQKYFLKKINNTKIFNLDDETLLMEFDDRVLGG